MHHAHFLANISEKEIADAIASAEQKTTGRIRVFVSHHAVDDPVAAAHARFAHLHMHHTPERNAILIFVAPQSHKFAVIGDQAIHQKCGDQFWNQLTQEMSEYFKREEWTPALLHGIRAAGDLLAEHFPAQHSDSLARYSGRGPG